MLRFQMSSCSVWWGWYSFKCLLRGVWWGFFGGSQKCLFIQDFQRRNWIELIQRKLGDFQENQIFFLGIMIKINFFYNLKKNLETRSNFFFFSKEKTWKIFIFSKENEFVFLNFSPLRVSKKDWNQITGERKDAF